MPHPQRDLAVDFAAGETAPVWEQGTKMIALPAWSGESATEVCIIGGGIAGLTTACFLARNGVGVTVIDAGGGDSDRRCGILTTAPERGFCQEMSTIGLTAARSAQRDRDFALALVRELVADHSMQCGLRDASASVLVSDVGTDGAMRMAQEAAVASLLGLQAASESVSIGAQRYPAMRIGGQAMLDPMAYRRELQRVLCALGGRLVAGRAERISHTRDTRTVPKSVVHGTRHAQITCDVVVLATNGTDHSALFGLSAYRRSRAVAVAVPMRETLLEPEMALTIDGAGVRVRRATIGGVPHLLAMRETPGAQPPARAFAGLLQWCARHWPTLPPPTARWSARIARRRNGAPRAGRFTDAAGRVFSIDGLGANAILEATLGAFIVARQIRRLAHATPESNALVETSLRLHGRNGRTGRDALTRLQRLLSSDDFTELPYPIH